MARLTHNPTRPDSSFRPVQLSTAEINRMREETARIVDNMERNRQATLKQGLADLQAMRENADYQRQQGQRNVQIEQQNLKAEQLEDQLKAQTAQQQAQLNQKAAQQVFGSLADLSQTAAKAAQQIALKKEEREITASYITGVVNPDYVSQLEFKNFEASLLQGGELYAGNIKIQEALGADPLTSAKGRGSNPSLVYFGNKGNATSLIASHHPIVYDQLINSGRMVDYKGQKVPISEARNNPELARWVGTLALKQVLKQTNLFGLDDKFLLPGLKIAEEYNLRRQAQASQLQQKNIDSQTEDLILSTIINNPDGLQTYGPSGIRQLMSLPHLGNAGALDKYELLVDVRDNDGNFRYSMEELGNLDIRGNGKPFKEEWSNRWSRMQETRRRLQIEKDRRELTLDDIEFAKDTKRIMDGLIAEPSEAHADLAIDYFVQNHSGRVPPDLIKFKASYTYEAREKIEGIKKLEAIPDGLVTMDAVAEACKLDRNACKVMAQRFEAQEAHYNRGIYKDTSDSFENTANGVTAFGSNKDNTAASVFLQDRMRAEYRKRVDQAVAGGMPFEQAATTVGQALDAEVRAGARDPNSKWFRKPDTPGGAAQFPNLNKGSLSALEKANRRIMELRKNIREKGLEAVISTKNSIITAEEVPAIREGYGKPGYTIHPAAAYVAGLSNGLDPIVIINSQFKELGEPPLQPPPSLASTGATISPTFRKLLYKNPSPERSARALGTANSFNPSIIPNNMGPMIQQAAQATGVNPAYIAAVVEVESAYNANAVSYNGSSFGAAQINRAAHPQFFAQQNWRDPQANINYGAQYYSGLLKKYKDPVAAAMAYNAGPGNYDAYLRGELPDGPIKTEMLNHGKKFAKAMYKYGGGAQALNRPEMMRSGSPMEQASLQTTPMRPLQSFAPNVASITFDTNQPGLDIFFKDKQFPAVLPGVVKDISFQGGPGKGYGNYVVIESIDPATNEKVDVLYSHLASKPNLRLGQMVRTGQIIGQQGGTGRVVSADGTIASLDFLRSAARGSKDMTPYAYYDSLRRRIAKQFQA